MNSSMIETGRRLPRWLLFFCCSAAASAQIHGRFYLEKEAFAQGEPVFLYFEASNSGSEPVDIVNSNPYAFCAGYDIQVSSDPKPGSSCARGQAGSCLLGSMTLQPGAKHTEQILVNYEHQISSSGDYVIEARRHLSYGLRPPFGPSVEFSERLHFFVDGNSQYNSAELQKWVAQAQSKDDRIRWEAARTLASLAPLSLEDTLLNLFGKAEFSSLAPLAFHRLNTPRAIAALAEFVKNTPAQTGESIQAARFLAETGDPQWFPLLLEMAEQHPRGGYLPDAAESGGERALPVLLEGMRSNVEYDRQSAIAAVGYTGSRDVVPILISLLNGSDTNTVEGAIYGLQLLTHRRPVTDAQPQAQYGQWLAWWSRHNRDAAIYKPTNCGDLVPLNKD
ncbi:MAG: HEAT repeat domain-containing protein [Acidobacteriia bacterium]|nr:HEAT repeat domain-containing protein [Terriglobia bacterium]